MPGAHLYNQKCTGHGCFPTRKNVEASPDVFVNGIAWHRQDDKWETHCCGLNCHDSELELGSQTVFINGRGAARIGDKIKCGSYCMEGSTDVFAGD